MTAATSGASPRLRAAFLATEDPRDVTRLSGSPFHMLQALERHFEIVLAENALPPWYRFLGRLLKAVSLGRVDYQWSPAYNAVAARRIRARLQAARPDVVFAVLATPITAMLGQEFRVVHVSDTTLRRMIGYYDRYSTFTPRQLRAAEILEHDAIAGSWLASFPSRWACRSAVEDYGAAPARVLEIAWGANMADTGAGSRPAPQGELRFLFVGVDWQRKGGPVALATMAELTRRGVACRLDVVGCSADMLPVPPPPNVHFHGFVGKSTPKGRALIGALYAGAHFYFLPTRAECFGLAAAEAMRHGLVPLSCDTGGVGSLIHHGETGLLLSPAADGAAWADAIQDLLAVPGRYAVLSAAGLEDASRRLTWQAWADSMTAAVTCRLQQER